LRERAKCRSIAPNHHNEWSQAPCLMIRLPAAPALTGLVAAIPPDAPSEVRAIEGGT